jgi:hypothetical protein
LDIALGSELQFHFRYSPDPRNQTIHLSFTYTSINAELSQRYRKTPSKRSSPESRTVTQIRTNKHACIRLSMIRDFEQWNANIGELSELQELSGCRVGVEAAEYLTNRILNSPRAKEPLVPALGGLPLALQQHIEEDLEAFKREGIEPWFVFSGLDITKQDEPFRQKQDEALVNANAWNLYDTHQAEASVSKFGESGEGTT